VTALPELALGLHREPGPRGVVALAAAELVAAAGDLPAGT
jgi:hypothetical protein